VPVTDYLLMHPTCFFILWSGWDEGCLTMSQGEIAKLTIPADKGYGKGGFPAWGYPFMLYQYLYEFLIL